MGLEEDIAFFEQVPPLAALGKQALRILAIGAETRHLQSGAVLFYAGELADGGYVVQEGSLLLEPGSLAEGGEVTVGPGTLARRARRCLPNTVVRQPAIATRADRRACGYPRSLFPSRCWRVLTPAAARQ